MKNQVVYKGAYLSEPLFNVQGVPNGQRRWILLIWQNGSQAYRMFSDLKFWAQRQVVQQGFSH